MISLLKTHDLLLFDINQHFLLHKQIQISGIQIPEFNVREALEKVQLVQRRGNVLLEPVNRSVAMAPRKSTSRRAGSHPVKNKPPEKQLQSSLQ